MSYDVIVDKVKSNVALERKVQMKIALIVRRLDVGGIENLILRISECLKANHDVCIISTEGTGFWDIKAEVIGIKVKKYCIWDYSDPLTFINRIAGHINEESFDAVYFNDTMIGNALSTLLHSNIKKISVLHALDSASTAVAFSNNEHINGFIAVSPRIKKIMNEHKLNNTFLIPNGVSDDYFDKSSSRDKADQNKLKLLYCGRLSHKDKGVLFIPELLDIFSLHFNQHFELTIIGDGPDRNQLEKLLKERHLTNFVSIMGNMSKENVIYEMKKAQFLIFPSLSEGFGLSILEAQSTGCIPVAFKIEGVTDYLINDNINGLLCEYGNVKDMFEKINSVYADKIKMNAISKAAILNSQNFKIEKTANEWIKIIDKMPLNQVESKENNINSIINVLSIAADQQTMSAKKKWLENYYNRLDGNLTLLKENGIKNVVIFGTMYMSHFIYANLLKEKFKIVSFIDNFKIQPSSINQIPIYNEHWLEENKDLYDAVIVSVESLSRKDIKENFEKKIPEKHIFDWVELL
ncbi:glycosyltransferase family 4 protein [Jeotgalibacillus soli]|uniref:Glycosyl transferase family 1 domain-containing protein n=1 Tax=Jeotgalibacillus soli TaxID=889306 RepID=A0A0C2RID9_9BACL|nr:glycosyltransferase family 4 protein [Jeotgalibacillus soli]KIL49930.1 hypothetical protein KP78_13980 [Jeotgalibacillus soli]